jgi:hypothetical protein
MKETILHMLSGAGSLLDISGHSKVSESQAKSLRFKLEDEDFYTSPNSDQANLMIDSMQWMPSEGRKVVSNWVEVYQQKDRSKAYVESGSFKLEKCLKDLKSKK